MIVPGHFAQTNRILRQMWMRDLDAVRDKWDDEASEAALAGNPQKAGYIEFLKSHLLP